MVSQQIIYEVITSVAISFGLYAVIKLLVRHKLANLKGAYKIVSLASMVIVLVEGIYLGLLFGIFNIASEVIASMGLAFALITFALINHLKNLVAGIGLHLNPEINVGDIIEIGEQKGTIIEMTLMKTIALTEEGKRIYIPNLKFSEEVTILHYGKR